MIQQTPKSDQFKQQLRASLIKETANSRAIIIKRNSHVYNCEDREDAIYFIEKGQIKLVMISPEGKECLLAIYTAGDVFGELSLSHLGVRRETATTMENTILKKIPSNKFFLRLQTDRLLEGFIRYLAVRIADQQQVITNLVTIDSEHRLGQVLMQLAHTMGQKNSLGIMIPLNISHEELSNMVGTTRPRISAFLQSFRQLGLIEISQERFFIIKEPKLAAYLLRSPNSSIPISKEQGRSLQAFVA